MSTASWANRYVSSVLESQLLSVCSNVPAIAAVMSTVVCSRVYSIGRVAAANGVHKPVPRQAAELASANVAEVEPASSPMIPLSSIKYIL
jgi:hypothetical protein